MFSVSENKGNKNIKNEPGKRGCGAAQMPRLTFNIKGTEEHTNIHYKTLKYINSINNYFLFQHFSK